MSGFGVHPSALLYVSYGCFVIWGFAVWLPKLAERHDTHVIAPAEVEL